MTNPYREQSDELTSAQLSHLTHKYELLKSQFHALKERNKMSSDDKSIVIVLCSLIAAVTITATSALSVEIIEEVGLRDVKNATVACQHTCKLAPAQCQKKCVLQTTLKECITICKDTFDSDLPEMTCTKECFKHLHENKGNVK